MPAFNTWEFQILCYGHIFLFKSISTEYLTLFTREAWSISDYILIRLAIIVKYWKFCIRQLVMYYILRNRENESSVVLSIQKFSFWKKIAHVSFSQADLVFVPGKKLTVFLHLSLSCHLHNNCILLLRYYQFFSIAATGLGFVRDIRNWFAITRMQKNCSETVLKCDNYPCVPCQKEILWQNVTRRQKKREHKWCWKHNVLMWWIMISTNNHRVLVFPVSDRTVSISEVKSTLTLD